MLKCSAKGQGRRHGRRGLSYMVNCKHPLFQHCSEYSALKAASRTRRPFSAHSPSFISRSASSHSAVLRGNPRLSRVCGSQLLKIRRSRGRLPAGVIQADVLAVGDRQGRARHRIIGSLLSLSLLSRFPQFQGYHLRLGAHRFLF